MNHEEAPDLRARNKQATREAIGAAALRLAVEQGSPLVRVYDIATEAGVSPRTYNNYFSSREEAICAFQADRARRIGQALLARPAGEPLGEAILAAVVEHSSPEPDRAGLRMIMSTPALEGEALKAFTMAEGPLAAAVAERIGADPETDMFSHVLAAAIAGAVRVAGRHWINGDGSESFATVAERAVRHILPATAPYDR
ncbi:TetR/AcrR family transcriptional regulator [Spongiactinospora sp. TRM90649]|uniref:TetR/AcrR family transcriptional regulator n=1 Tax=Spongiactinospora sp. TRM90649 TaxID=3031114 RepID=UPI0023FA0765|nr:TetR/AcrR family transcriptional regulator [Spongiactinospora sp. TRM90649]MDF5754658.1 TetR/AcrR family transcriptional regulator [Spongiactinospora sp. TRM90649]